MAHSRSPEEVEAHHLEKLGPKLGPIFHALYNEHAWLVGKWQEFCVLFGTSKERIDLMNEAARFFFYMLQGILFEDTLLHICRITDSPEVSGKKNLTIQALPANCDDAELRGDLGKLVQKALKASQFARDWRNRRIAHRDLALALKDGANPLESATRAKVAGAISAIHDVLNLISERLMHSTTMDETCLPPTGAERLLYLLRDGIEAQKAREERIRARRPNPADLKPRTI